jgi:peptide-N4-(N-acetyl-beta-glucosaminyl)asparagine amidase
MSLETRYILDFTDHVWIEFFSESEKRWIHLDPCENAFDTPMVYEQGWGKKLNYVIAFGDYEVKDVTSKYTLDYKQVLTRRTLGGEYRILHHLNEHTRALRRGVRDSLSWELESRDMKEYTVHQKLDWTTFLPRQSGSLEWRTARGEMGQ